MNKQSTINASPTIRDWVMFALMIFLGGGAFSIIQVAVQTIPPIVVATGRLWFGAIALYIVMRLAGRQLPDVTITQNTGKRINPQWLWLMAIAFFGYVLPFNIFPWAQQSVPSGLAGIFMAFMPIWTIILAHYFGGEHLSPQKMIGVGLGIAGMIVLIGPDVIVSVASSSLTAQAALLGATFLYAIGAILTKRAPEMPPRVLAAGALLCATVMSAPLLLFAEVRFSDWSVAGMLSVIALGVGPTAAATLILIALIKRVGAGFMALSNYLTPIWAVLLGAILFRERLEITAFIALALSLAGVAVAQYQRNQKTPTD